MANATGGGCKKTFNEWTGTPISRVRKKTSWPAFAQSMKLGLPTKDAASISAVSKKTAFRWRHKVLESLDGLTLPPLTGIVEADETFSRRSYKGRKVVGRKPRKRGGQGSRRGTGKDKIVVVVACDRSGHVKLKNVDRSNATSITLAVLDIVDPAATLCTDASGAFAAATAVLGMDHVVLKGKHRTAGVYHIQTVNAAHSQLNIYRAIWSGSEVGAVFVSVLCFR